jgi:hypothetical protein
VRASNRRAGRCRAPACLEASAAPTAGAPSSRSSPHVGAATRRLGKLCRAPAPPRRLVSPLAADLTDVCKNVAPASGPPGVLAQAAADSRLRLRRGHIALPKFAGRSYADVTDMTTSAPGTAPLGDDAVLPALSVPSIATADAHRPLDVRRRSAAQPPLGRWYAASDSAPCIGRAPAGVLSFATARARQHVGHGPARPAAPRRVSGVRGHHDAEDAEPQRDGCHEVALA